MKKVKVVLVTGAARGIGRALVEELSRRSHKVYAAARSWSEATYPAFETLTMDVRDDRSVADAVGAVLSSEGHIDVCINNAGVSLSGPVEETPLESARNVFETNYFGTVRVTKAVVPVMRRQGHGTLVNVASAAGKIGIPFQAHYAASKFAVEGFTEALYHELRGHNIRVYLIEPGDVRTAIWKRSEHVFPEGSPYAQALARFHAVKSREMGDAAVSPDTVAHRIADVIESDTGKLRHPVAGMAGALLLARKLIPDAIFLYGVGRNYGVRK